MKLIFYFSFSFAIIFLNSTFAQSVPPAQGDVVINSFDPHYGTSNKDEFVVLVNRTNKYINLNGYEVQTFDKDGSTKRSFYQWNSSFIMVPYSFLLISTFPNVLGVSRDLAFDESLGNFDEHGFISLRKQSPTQQSDYIDLVIYQTGGPVFTGVPLNSGVSINYSNIVDAGDGDAANLLATRGGIANNLSSCTYSGFFIAADFITQLASLTEIQNSSSSPLPVELESFSAIKLGTSVKLIWKTSTEVNNYGFDVERKSVEGQWKKLGFVEGSGNSNSVKEYSYIDGTVESGKYIYRLKQIDSDGKYNYSRDIEIDLSVPLEFELSQNYPNPFNPITSIKYSIPEKGEVRLSVYNLLGEEIAILVNEFKEQGVHEVSYDASSIASGVYIYRLESLGNILMNKMILLK